MTPAKPESITPPELDALAEGTVGIRRGSRCRDVEQARRGGGWL